MWLRLWNKAEGSLLQWYGQCSHILDNNHSELKKYDHCNWPIRRKHSTEPCNNTQQCYSKTTVGPLHHNPKANTTPCTQILVKPLWTIGLCHIQQSAKLRCTYGIPDTSQLPASQPITDVLPIQLKLCFWKCRLLWQKITGHLYHPKVIMGDWNRSFSNVI